VNGNALVYKWGPIVATIGKRETIWCFGEELKSWCRVVCCAEELSFELIWMRDEWSSEAMVDLSGNAESGGPIEHGFSNWVFVVPALITASLVGFFFYKLIQSLMDKEKKKEEKKKIKQQKKDSTKKKVKWLYAHYIQNYDSLFTFQSITSTKLRKNCFIN